jgi:phage gpG-like protein
VAEFVPNPIAIEEMLHEPGGPVWREMEKIGIEGTAIAKRFCPVVSGALRDSIHHEVAADGSEVLIGSNLSYAIYIEFGTGHGNWVGGPTEADPFLRPMLMVVRP